VNPPVGGRSNGSKPFQMRRLARAGFAVPRWATTNDPSAARAFAASCPAGAVYKSCSGLRAHVRLLDEALLERLSAGSTPVVVQEFVAGHDVRVHTVHGRAFATKITAEGVDYRYAESESRYEATGVPEPVEALCHRVAAEERLALAGFDFRVTHEGVWHCLEVNPVPTFLPYEMTTGQPIADAILDLFARLPAGPRA
jgi:glutathione synthase/RimK-type ligase-like ATP-grasp enzyme